MNIKTMFTVIMILTMFSGVKAETVENLERMRAKTLTVMFDKNINLNQRADKVQKLKLKLLDMEKIVLNDKNLSNNPVKYGDGIISLPSLFTDPSMPILAA